MPSLKRCACLFNDGKVWEECSYHLEERRKLQDAKQDGYELAKLEYRPQIIELEGKLGKREKGLRDVMRHLEIVSPTGYQMSGAWNIAKIALEEPTK